MPVTLPTFRSAASSLTVIAWFLSLIGCRPSTKELPASASDTRLEIHVEQSSERRTPVSFEIHRITAVLRNKKGTAIESETVGISVNDVPMKYMVSTGNYYDRYPYYVLNDGPTFALKPATEYRFIVKWPDGKTLDAGAIRTPPPLSLDQLDVPKNHPVNQDLAIVWRDIAAPADLEARWTLETFDASGSPVDTGAPFEEKVVHKKLGPGLLRSTGGKLVIPASSLAASKETRATRVSITVRADVKTDVGRTLAEGSVLDAVRLLTCYVDLHDGAREANP